MIVITGATGFIGSNILSSLNELGRDDIILCDSENKNSNLKNIKNRKFSEFIEPTKLMYYLNKNKNIQTIIHMGANSSTIENNYKLMYRQNTRFSKDLWKWSKDNNVRFIYASSAAIYGDGSSGFSDSDSLNNYEPLNVYAWTKYFFDRYVTNQAHLNHTPPQWVGLRFFNVYGPNEYHKGTMQSVLKHAFNQHNSDGEVKLFKSYNKDYRHGQQMRDFIYIKDCVSIILWFLKSPEVSGIFNCGTGKARSFNDLILAMYYALNRKPIIKYIEMPENLINQYQYFTQANMLKIKRLGYKNNFYSLEDGVSDYVNNYLLTDKPYR